MYLFAEYLQQMWEKMQLGVLRIHMRDDNQDKTSV